MKKLLHRTMMFCLLCLSAATVYAQGEAGQRNPGTREQIIYKTNFTNWTESLHAANQVTPGTQNTKTVYTEENVTFTYSGVDVLPTGTNGSYTGYVQAMKTGGTGDDYTTAAKAYIETSAFATVKKVTFTHVATGGNRGWRLLAKGDGDDNWVVVSTATTGTTATAYTVNVGKTNCKLRFENLQPTEFAYLLDLQVYADIDMTQFPMLGTFKANEKTADWNNVRYAGAYTNTFNGTTTQYFELDENGNFTCSYELKRADNILSETNPITEVNAAWGKVLTDQITYKTTGEGTNDQQTVVTIPVTLESLDRTMNFVATFKLLPMLTVTYYGLDSEAEIGTQDIEKYATINEYPYNDRDVNNVTPIPSGETFRGWYAKKDVNIRISSTSTSNTSRLAEQKILTTDVIVEPLFLKAKASEIETQEPGTTWTYNLNNFFYPDDHENFNYCDDSGHDYAAYNYSSGNYGRYRPTTNGGNYWFYGDEKIELVVSGKADITFTLQKGGSDSQKITLADNNGWSETISSKVTNNGDTRTIQYRPDNGEPATLLMTFNEAIYVKTIVIANLEEEIDPIEGTNWYVVKKGDAKNFINTLNAVNNNTNVDFEGNLERVFVYIPEGTYDLGQSMLTISRDKVSFIGENLEKTIIKNQPLNSENTGTSAFTLRNNSKQLYMQDLSIENHFDFYGRGGGQAFAFWDRGDSTICKNVRLYGHQDTYHSDNNAGKFYWENAQIHGVVDFICGHGTALFADTRIVLEPSISGKGFITIGTPFTETYRLDNSDPSTERDAYGYTFKGCYIDASKLAEGETYSLGRAWDGTPRMTWLNTRLSPDIYKLEPTRFTTKCMEALPDWFKIYNTTVDDDPQIYDGLDQNWQITYSLELKNNTEERKLNTALSTIDNAYGDENYQNGEDYMSYYDDKTYPAKFAPFLYNPEYYTPENLFYGWNPTNDTKQLSLTSESLVYDQDSELIQWDSVDGATAYAIYADDEFIGFALPDNEMFEVQDHLASKYSVRVANAMGGLGLPTEVSAPDVITIQLDDKTMVYGDALPEFTYTSTSTEPLDGEIDIYCYEIPETEAVSSATGVGEYDITGEKGGASGRIVVLPGKLTITKAPLTVGVKDAEVVQGSTPEFEMTYTGWKNSDDAVSVFTGTDKPLVKIDSSYEPNELPVGDYTIYVEGPEETDNYTITYGAPATLVVTELNGIETLNVSAGLDVYTLQGMKIKRMKTVQEFNQLERGIYIVKQGGKTYKVNKKD